MLSEQKFFLKPGQAPRNRQAGMVRYLPPAKGQKNRPVRSNHNGAENPFAHTLSLLPLRAARTRWQKLFLRETEKTNRNGLHALSAHGRHNKGVFPALPAGRARATVVAGKAALWNDTRTVVVPDAAAQEHFMGIAGKLHQPHIVIFCAGRSLGNLNFGRDA